jgi:hypothetical protein
MRAILRELPISRQLTLGSRSGPEVPAHTLAAMTSFRYAEVRHEIASAERGYGLFRPEFLNWVTGSPESSP